MLYLYKPSKEALKAIRLKKTLHTAFKRKLKKVEEHRPYCNKCKVCIRCLNCDQAWENYKTQRNLSNKITKANKRQNLIDDLKAKSIVNDLKGIWKSIKISANMAPKSNKQPESGNTLDVNEFNQHFSTIGTKLQTEAPCHDNISFTDFMPEQNNNCNFSSFREITSGELEAYIKTIAVGKSTFDILPLKIFKSILPCIIEPLTHVVNLSLTTGQVPEFCKYAQVTPIPKGGDCNDPNNYRPISILPILTKCIEYFVNEQLTEFVEENNILTSQQYGFRKNHSTTYLMLDLFDQIFDSKGKSYTPGIIFLDIKKAFDTVDHCILIKKLKFYGLDGTVILWFENYLSGRYQCTKIAGQTSSFLHVRCGVPQGSILGPLLFSIYINDMVNACNLSKPYLFADDGALLFNNICRQTFIGMKIELMTIIKWLNVNKLTLSIEKTNYIVFDNVENCGTIELGSDIVIKECKSTKYLGLIVDNLLKFDLHIDYIKKKVQKRIGAMYRASSLLPIKFRKMFANAIMLPQFDYLDTIYTRASKSKLKELDILYKKVAKIALGVEKTESSLNVYKDMKWLPLHLRRQLHLSSYMFKIIKNRSPSNFMNKFTFISGGSRDGDNCNLYTPKSKSLKHFYYLGAKAWNNLPKSLRNLDDASHFNGSYKAQLLQAICKDDNYSINNSYDFFYKLIEIQL